MVKTEIFETGVQPVNTKATKKKVLATQNGLLSGGSYRRAVLDPLPVRQCLLLAFIVLPE